MVFHDLSQKSFASISLSLFTFFLQLIAMNVCFITDFNGSVIANLQLNPIFPEQVKESKYLDEELLKFTWEVQNGENLYFTLTKNGVLLYQNILCYLIDENLSREILKEKHTSSYAMHPRGTEMYKTI